MNKVIFERKVISTVSQLINFLEQRWIDYIDIEIVDKGYKDFTVENFKKCDDSEHFLFVMNVLSNFLANQLTSMSDDDDLETTLEMNDKLHQSIREVIEKIIANKKKKKETNVSLN